MGKPIDLNALRTAHGRRKRIVVTNTLAEPKGLPLDLRLGAKDTTTSGQMNIRVSDDFKRVLGDGARELGISMAQLVEEAVRDYLIRQRKARK